MHNYKKLLFPIFTFWLLSFSSVFAWWIDHFEVILNPKTANIWEAVDLTIKAVDKNNVTVTDYNWTIVIFSETDQEAILPRWLEDNTYSFVSSDQWEIKFENAVIFNNSWNQDLYVYDLDDDTVLWVWEISITKQSTKQENTEISILSPENGLVIWNDYINISWTTQKNHNINIIINDSKTIKITSNDQWTFETKISNLSDWKNKIKAQILDSDSKVIWESSVVEIEVNSNQPSLKNIQVSPESVEIESSYNIELITNSLVANASVIINDNVIELDKESEWIFKKSVYSPSKEWNYSIWVILKDELWHEVTELWVWNIVVNKPELNVSSTWSEETKVELTSPKEEKLDLTIKWLKVIELKSKSILSWDKIEWVEWYNVYKKSKDKELEFIQKVTEPKFEVEFDSDEVKYDYFVVKAIAKTSSWELYEWSLSDATKVKTWPEILILFLVSIIIAWMLFMTKSKKA